MGWGEGTLEGRSEVVLRQLESLAPFFIGADSKNLNYLREQITKQPFYAYNCPVMNSAMAALDIALWDIAGKRAGLPLAVLLGGPLHARIPTYFWFGRNVPDSGVVSQVEGLLERRDPAKPAWFKMNGIGPTGLLDVKGACDKAARVLEPLYERFADTQVRFGVDCHGRLDMAGARRYLDAIHPFRKILMFVEELLPVREIDQLAVLAKETPIPLATGERLYEIGPFTKLITSGAVALVQPDVTHAQGITTCLEVGRLAAAHGVDTSYHCPNGPVSFAASLIMKSLLPGDAPQECSEGIHYSGDKHVGDYLLDPDVIQADASGYVAVPAGPGLGIELSEESLDEGAKQKLWDESECYLYSEETGCPRAW